MNGFVNQYDSRFGFTRYIIDAQSMLVNRLFAVRRVKTWDFVFFVCFNGHCAVFTHFLMFRI
jgi:hypothetical protein